MGLTLRGKDWVRGDAGNRGRTGQGEGCRKEIGRVALRAVARFCTAVWGEGEERLGLKLSNRNWNDKHEARTLTIATRGNVLLGLCNFAMLFSKSDPIAAQGRNQMTGSCQPPTRTPSDKQAAILHSYKRN